MTGRRRSTAAAALAAVALAGCGGGDADERTRERVDAYAKAQNEVMGDLAPDVERLNRDYVAFARGRLDPGVAERRLARAERVVREARERTAGIEAPAEAMELQTRLRDYLDVTVDLATQTRQLAGYEPATQAALRPLPRINRDLQRDLGEAADAAAQVDVLRRYGDRLGDVIDDLEAVEVPVVQQPAHADQVRRLERTRALGDELRDAVGDEDPAAVARLLTAFREQAAKRPRSGRLARRGLGAYEERVDRLRAASADLRREQLRLYQSVDGRDER